MTNLCGRHHFLHQTVEHQLLNCLPFHPSTFPKANEGKFLSITHTVLMHQDIGISLYTIQTVN